MCPSVKWYTLNVQNTINTSWCYHIRNLSDNNNTGVHIDMFVCSWTSRLLHNRNLFLFWTLHILIKSDTVFQSKFCWFFILFFFVHIYITLKPNNFKGAWLRFWSKIICFQFHRLQSFSKVILIIHQNLCVSRWVKS